MPESPLARKAGGAAVDPEDFNAVVDVVAAGLGGGSITEPVTIKNYDVGETGLTIQAPAGAAANVDGLIDVSAPGGGVFYYDAAGGLFVDGHGIYNLNTNGVVGLFISTNGISYLNSVNPTGVTGEVSIGGGGVRTTFDGVSTFKLGFHNANPVLKPTVSGSRGGNAALASLLTALANMGLITNSTTA